MLKAILEVPKLRCSIMPSIQTYNMLPPLPSTRSYHWLQGPWPSTPHFERTGALCLIPAQHMPSLEPCEADTEECPQFSPADAEHGAGPGPFSQLALCSERPENERRENHVTVIQPPAPLPPPALRRAYQGHHPRTCSPIQTHREHRHVDQGAAP